MSRIVVVLAIAVTLGGCATMSGPSMGRAEAQSGSAAFGLTPGDSAAYRRNLSVKLQSLRNVRAERASGGESAKRSFRRWSAAGLAIGLAGGVLGAVVDDKDDAARAGAIGSAVTGAISGWLGARKYESEAAAAEKCKAARDSAIGLFGGAWTPDSTPKTDAEVTQYEAAYAAAHKTIGEGCPA